MEQSFLLKKHANLSTFEQGFMPAEERAWWIDRINRDIQKDNERNTSAPGMPNPMAPEE